MRAGLGGPDPKAASWGEIYLGDKDFVRHKRSRRRPSSEVPRRQREPIPCSLAELLRTRSADAVALANKT